MTSIKGGQGGSDARYYRFARPGDAPAFRGFSPRFDPYQSGMTDWVAK
jgi:hypothetical protein